MLKRGRKPNPVTIRGVEYPSQAAQALGVSIGGISHAIRRGTLDYVGMGTRSPVVAARSEIERLRAALKDTTENGLLYWEPQTSRGAMNKATMIERNRALYEGDA